MGQLLDDDVLVEDFGDGDGVVDRPLDDVVGVRLDDDAKAMRRSVQLLAQLMETKILSCSFQGSFSTQSNSKTSLPSGKTARFFMLHSLQTEMHLLDLGHSTYECKEKKEEENVHK